MHPKMAKFPSQDFFSSPMQKQDSMKAKAPENQQHSRIKAEGTTRRMIRENKVKLWLMGNIE